MLRKRRRIIILAYFSFLYHYTIIPSLHLSDNYYLEESEEEDSEDDAQFSDVLSDMRAYCPQVDDNPSSPFPKYASK